MSLDDDFQILLSDTERFLKQQAELYGDMPLIPKTPDAPAIEQAIHHQQQIVPKIPPSSMTPKPKGELFEKSQPASALPASPQESWTSAENIPSLDQAINQCLKCSLGKTRTKFVFGVGNPKAQVVVVGEAPGADEDAQGEPFVGRGGQLLNKILESIHFKREEVFICNILKCRPPNNRDPQPEEIELCEPYLWKQLELIKPRLILCVGRIAGQSLLKTNSSLAQLRGKVHDYRGIPLMVTYHPAALLRNPNWKRPCWEDVQQFRKLYEELNPRKS
jgi:uracil-DNA glycosylase